MRIINTAGYGNEPPTKFQQKLADAEVDAVFDVRRKGSHARIIQYNPGERMCKTLWRDSLFAYRLMPRLGNYAASLSQYSLDGKEDIIEAIAKWMIHFNIYDPCFLCCELHAYVDGEVNCHRVYVAEAVAKKLREMTGEEWEVRHL